LPETLGLWFLHVVLSVLWGSLLVTLFYAGTTPDPIPVRLLAANSLAIWAVYIAGPTLVTRARGDGPVSELWPQVSLSDIPIGLVIGAALQWLVLPVVYWPILQISDVEPSEAAQELVDAIDGRLDLVLFSLVVAVGAPLAEEFFYRGMVLQAIRRHTSDLVAVLGSAGLFAIIHVQPILFPGTFVLGVVAAVATLRTRRLGLAFAMHVGFNGATLLTLLVF
jgi:membrane protease YdiL (CAAX protease family)